MFIKLHFSFQNSNNHDLGLQSDAAVKNCKKLYILLHLLCILDTFQDFLIKLDIKPLIHLLEISIFSLNNVILRLTKIMNRADKNWAHF